MRKLIVAATMLFLASPAFAAVGEIGQIGGTTYIVIDVTDIGKGNFVVTVASDKNGVQTVFMEAL